MTRSLRIGWVLVAVIAAACSSGATATGIAPSSTHRPSPPPIVPPTAAPSPSRSPESSTSPGPLATCSEDPTLADVIALDQDPGPLTVAFRPIYGHYSEAALACYRESQLRFIAFMAAPEGLGGVEEYRIEPLWLTGRGHWLAVDDAVEPEGFFSGPFLSVAVPPAEATAFEALRDSWVEIRGHFSDAAADGCKVAEGSPPVAPTAEQAIEICRTAFVVTGSQPQPVPSPT